VSPIALIDPRHFETLPPLNVVKPRIQRPPPRRAAFKSTKMLTGISVTLIPSTPPRFGNALLQVHLTLTGVSYTLISVLTHPPSAQRLSSGNADWRTLHPSSLTPPHTHRTATNSRNTASVYPTPKVPQRPNPSSVPLRDQCRPHHRRTLHL
jgi:hypothetical protein